MTAPFLSVIIPVRNEQDNIGPMLKGLAPYLPEGSEIIVVAASALDPTLQVLPRTMEIRRGCAPGGVAEQLKWGFEMAYGEAILVSMADMSDDPLTLSSMLLMYKWWGSVWGSGSDMVCASRYMKGGRQVGAPRVKSWLSWFAGWSLHVLGLPTHDPSNSYKLYRASKLKALDLSGSVGFDINLQIIDAALRADPPWRITEVPTTWRGRQHGDSSFRFWRWLPYYARWWLRIAWRLTTRLWVG